ncbi:hypothetical protein H4R34_004958, partial [Dimargaris verticillata]
MSQIVSSFAPKIRVGATLTGRLFSTTAQRQSSVNKAVLVGFVGNDADTHETQSGKVAVNFNLATSRTYKNKEDELVTATQWHRIKSFHNADREYVSEIAKKGNMVYVEGEIRYENYTDKEGNDRNTTSIYASTIRRLRNKESKPAEE